MCILVAVLFTVRFSS